MENIQQIQVKGMIVLTTEQIAKAYETTPEKIRWNFKYNRKKYAQGKHYMLIDGEELRELKRECEFQTLFKQAKSVCLWTEKGALLHAKSLNTDKAWEVYDYLVDHYFRVKDATRQQSSEAIVPVKPKGTLLVDIPVNDKAQELIRELKKNMVGLEVVLDMYNRYSKEEDNQRMAYMVKTIGFNVADIAYNLSSVKPKLIEKVL